MHNEEEPEREIRAAAHASRATHTHPLHSEIEKLGVTG